MNIDKIIAESLEIKTAKSQLEKFTNVYGVEFTKDELRVLRTAFNSKSFKRFAKEFASYTNDNVHRNSIKSMFKRADMIADILIKHGIATGSSHSLKLNGDMGKDFGYFMSFLQIDD